MRSVEAPGASGKWRTSTTTFQECFVAFLFQVQFDLFVVVAEALAGRVALVKKKIDSASVPLLLTYEDQLLWIEPYDKLKRRTVFGRRGMNFNVNSQCAGLDWTYERAVERCLSLIFVCGRIGKRKVAAAEAYLKVSVADFDLDFVKPAIPPPVFGIEADLICYLAVFKCSPD